MRHSDDMDHTKRTPMEMRLFRVKLEVFLIGMGTALLGGLEGV